MAVTGDSMSRGILTPIWAALQSERTHVDHQEAGGFLIEKTRVAFDERLRTNPPDVFVMLLATWENAALQSGEVINPADPAWPEIYRRDFLQPWVDRAAAAGSDDDLGGHAVDPPRAHLGPEPAAQHHLAGCRPPVSRTCPGSTAPGSWRAPTAGTSRSTLRCRPPQRLFNLDGLAPVPGGVAAPHRAVLNLLADQYGATTNPGWHDTDWRSDPEAYKPGECPAPA